MIQGYQAGLSGILYNKQRLDAVSHNMANANTTGFRRAGMVLRTREEHPFSKYVDSAVRKRLPEIYGMERTGNYVDHVKTGETRETGNSMHVALDTSIPNAFFAVQNRDPSDNTTYYTRNGTLSFGNLTPGDPNSESILLMSGHTVLDEGSQPIQVDPSLGEISVTNSGAIYQAGEEIGKLPAYRFNKSQDPNVQSSSNLQAMERLGESLFKIPDAYAREFNPFKIEVGEHGVKNIMKQGALEGSNVNIVGEMMEMMNASKSGSANQKAMKLQMDGLAKLFQLVRR